MHNKKQEVENLGALVRGELAAVETYKQALDKVTGQELVATELRAIESDHEEALTVLQERMTELNETPPADSGLWGEWSKAVEGAAAALGDKAAIKALKEGEEHGVNSYEKALRDQALDDEIRQIIRSQLLPKTKAHIAVLDDLLVKAGR